MVTGLLKTSFTDGGETLESCPLLLQHKEGRKQGKGS